jgi:hypothetical protein
LTFSVPKVNDFAKYGTGVTNDANLLAPDK